MAHFLVDTHGVPAVVLEALAPQLGLLPMSLGDYPQDDKTRTTHLERIRQHLGFVRCARAQRQRLLAHLTSVAPRTPRTDALRKEAEAWLLGQRIVRPGRTTLRDLDGRLLSARGQHPVRAPAAPAPPVHVLSATGVHTEWFVPH